MRAVLWISSTLFVSVGLLSMLAPLWTWGMMMRFNARVEKLVPPLAGHQDRVLVRGNERFLARFAGCFPLVIGVVGFLGLLWT